MQRDKLFSLTPIDITGQAQRTVMCIWLKINEREWQIKMTCLAGTLISALHRELLCHARTFTYPGPLIQNSFENVGFFFSFLIKFLLD